MLLSVSIFLNIKKVQIFVFYHIIFILSTKSLAVRQQRYWQSLCTYYSSFKSKISFLFIKPTILSHQIDKKRIISQNRLNMVHHSNKEIYPFMTIIIIPIKMYHCYFWTASCKCMPIFYLVAFKLSVCVIGSINGHA